MTYSCTSPTSTSEEDWINEVLSFSPLDLTTSHDLKSSLASPEFGPDPGHETAPEFEDLFSSISSDETSASSPGSHAQTHENASDHKLLDHVSCELQKLKENNCLTPKALESLFNVQDVLADSGDWQTDHAKPKHRRSRASIPGHQGESQNGKSSCHMRQKAGAMHSQCHRKRKGSRVKAPKSAHPHGPHSLSTSPLGSRNASVVSLSSFTSSMSEPYMGPSMPQSACETPFPESWYNTPSMPVSGTQTPCVNYTDAGEFAPSNTCFDGSFEEYTGPQFTPVTVSPIAENPTYYNASAGSMPGSVQQPMPAKGACYDAALQEAIAYIDFLQEENMLQQASLERAI